MTEERLPSNKVQRLANQTKGLVDDVKSWIDLKLSLTQIEIEDKVNLRVNEAVVNAAVAVIGIMCLFFLLVAGALALGQLLDNMVYGFLIVAGALLLILLIVLMVRPRLIDIHIRRDRNS